MRRSPLFFLSLALLSGVAAPARAVEDPDEAALRAAAHTWLDLYQSHRRSELCELLTDDFTTRSDWGGRTGRPADKKKFCATPGATRKNPTFLVFDLSGFAVERGAKDEATVRFTQYFCQEREGFSYSSIGRVSLALRHRDGRWRYAQEIYTGERRQKREGCLPVPAPTRPACAEHVCPHDSVLFPRLQAKVCRGEAVSPEEYRVLTPHDVLLLSRTFSALHGYQFRQPELRDYFYGPGASERFPAACRFTPDPDFTPATKMSPLSREQFRQMVEMRDHYEGIETYGPIPGVGDL